MSGENKGEGGAQSKRPVDNDFQQQRLRAWQPLLTPPWVIVTFSVVGALFLILGIICLVETKKVIEYTSSTYEVDDGSLPVQTPVDIMVSEDMKAPVFMYYQLTNFYQNHRRYVKSRSDSQLRGESSPDTGNCDPLEKNGAGDTYYPCGLIANSFFNDNFTVSIVGRAQPLSYDNNGIAWSSDKSDKFKARAPVGGETTVSKEGNVLPSVDNEDFIVWMRTAGLPTFKKLKFIIREDIPAGSTVRVNVWQNYKVKGFGGTKAVVLSTANWLGGRNTFLGIAYLVVGAICVVLALAFGAKHHFSPRPLGDMRYFNWPGVRASAAGRS